MKLSTERFYIGNFSHINEGVIALESNDMRNVNREELIEDIKDIFYMNYKRALSGEPRDLNNSAYIWGAPGIGKTSIIKSLAKTLDVAYMALVLNRFEAVDFRGVPVVENILGSNNPDDEATINKTPGLFPRSDGPNNKGGILFLDELNTSRPDVLNAALTLVLEGKIDTYKLPEKWIVVAASNRESDLLAGSHEKLSAPLSTRFSHRNFVPELKEWIGWCLGLPKEKNPEGPQKHINPDIIGFLTMNPDYYYKVNTEKNLTTKGFPIPRTWDLASREDYFKRDPNNRNVMKADYKPEMEDSAYVDKMWKNTLPMKTITNIYQPWVGLDATTMFVSYLKLKDFYNAKDIEDVYTKGAKAKKLPTQLDQATAACYSIAFFKKGKIVTASEVQNVYDFAVSATLKELQSTLMSYFVMIHPEIKEDKVLAKIRWEMIKKWHIEDDDTGMSIKK